MTRLITAPLALAALTWTGAALAQQSSDTIEVRGGGVSAEAPVGPHKQPEWSAHRPFATSRVYVIPEGELETELWVKHQTFKDQDGETPPPATMLQQEIEYGLPGRLQLDLYVNEINEENEDGDRKWDMEGQQYELRWALADWGAIPLNPTFYFEYHPRKNAPEKGEIRLLLADNLAPDWHYSVNLGYEIELWGEERERELLASLAVGTTTLTPKLSIGLEAKREWVDVKDDRGHFARELVVGPSFQWRPTKGVHVDLAPLFGVEDTAPKTETWMIVGVEL